MEGSCVFDFSGFQLRQDGFVRLGVGEELFELCQLLLNLPEFGWGCAEVDVPYAVLPYQRCTPRGGKCDDVDLSGRLDGCRKSAIDVPADRSAARPPRRIPDKIIFAAARAGDSLMIPCNPMAKTGPITPAKRECAIIWNLVQIKVSGTFNLGCGRSGLPLHPWGAEQDRTI